ncbi:MAG: NAD(P)H-hydrate dehydratase [Erysipelotrichaceae bacterium]|nr:NAD(P)H-hydrate dehydratase [Erysipelotrichaceae bacterium]
MKVVTAREMARIESRDLALRRMNEEDLVLSVAMSLEDHIVHDGAGSVLLLCGPGRNGYYGLMTAHLLSLNPGVSEVAVASETIQGHRYHMMLIDDDVQIIRSQRALKEEIGRASYIVDCIYGYEDNGCEIEYPYDRWIQWVNESQAEVLSCDIPSGINCDDGSLCGQQAVKAAQTMAVQLAKIGSYLYPGSEFTGKLFVSNVGLSYDSITANETLTEVNSHRDIAGKLPRRSVHSHKGTYGKVLLAAGSQKTPGAALLCATATLRTGAGLLTVFSTPEVLHLINSNLYEAMSLPLDEDHFHDQLSAMDLDRYSLLTMGPGLGVNRQTELLMEKFLNSNLPCIIDADGLYYLKDHLDLLRRPALTVITPHEVEFDRVFGFDRANLTEDLRRYTTEYPSLVIVFKGEHTLIAHQGHITINTTGNNALAKGGSGDALTGIITGFMAQNVSVDSVTAAVYVHSLAADQWVRQQSDYSMLASDVIEGIDKAIREIREQS